MHSIQGDHNRFRKIVKGAIKKHLRKYLKQGEMIGRQGKRLVSIPIPEIDMPRFRYGSKKQGGVGQGDGEVGDAIGHDGDPADGSGQAGDTAGKHILEVDVSLEELAQILGEALELPNIQPKGKKSIQTEKHRYSGIRRTGPESLRHFKRTYKEALRRSIATGEYDPQQPSIVPIKDDTRYRSWKTTQIPHSNAVIILMMDVSGSMGAEQKQMVRTLAFWIETWLKSQYKEIVIEYIVHDAEAKIVDSHTFYNLREGGGTRISSAYTLCNDLIDGRNPGKNQVAYPPDEWNIYPFHFSDGDNWGEDDTLHCIELIENELLPKCNQFGYAQVKSGYGAGSFLNDLQHYFTNHPDEEMIAITQLASLEDTAQALKDFFGKGN